MREHSVLRHFLSEVPQHELVESLIRTIDSFTEGDDEAYKRIKHYIVTYVQTRKILRGESMLRAYQEPHKKELFVECIKATLHIDSTDSKAIDTLYRSFQEANLPFSKWITQER